MLVKLSDETSISNFPFVHLTVMAMESQAEAVGQLTTDDLDGKVTGLSLHSRPLVYFYI